MQEHQGSAATMEQAASASAAAPTDLVEKATAKKPAHKKNVASTTTLDIQNELDHAEEAEVAPTAAAPRSSSVLGRRPQPVVVDTPAAPAATTTTTTIVAATTDSVSEELLARVAGLESQLSELALIVADLIDRVEQMGSRGGGPAAGAAAGVGSGASNGPRRGRGRGPRQHGKRGGASGGASGSAMARAN